MQITLYFAVVIAICFKFVTGVKNESISHLPGHREMRWFIETPNLPLILTSFEVLSPGSCKEQLKLYSRDLQNGTLWAVQMYDAATRSISGVIEGNMRHFGNFDQCYSLEVDVPNSATPLGHTHVTSKYCLVDMTYNVNEVSNNNKGRLELEFDPNGSIWEAIKEKGDSRRVKRYSTQFALCVPAVCSPKDIETVLKGPLKKFGDESNLLITANINPRKCQTKHDHPEFTFKAKIFCAFTLSLLGLVIFATWYDLKIADEKTPTLNNYLLCFSAIRSFNSFSSVNYTHRGLDCIHFVRLFSMMVLVAGPTFAIFYYNPVINSLHYEKSFESPIAAIVHNGTIPVDAFFLMSAILTAFGLLGMYDKYKQIYITRQIISRYMRFTPLVAFIVFFYATMLPYIGSGPYYKFRALWDYEQCSTNWWPTLLYINNYVTPNKMCLFQTWYLAVLWQCYIGSLFVLYAFCKMPRTAGYTFLGILLALSSAIPFYMSYVKGVEPFLFIWPYYHDVPENNYFLNYYIATHMRAPVFIIGLIVGAVMYDTKSSNWKLPKTLTRVLFVTLVFLMSGATQLYANRFFDMNVKVPQLDTALFAALHRIIFATSYSSIILLVAIGDGLDFLYKILTPPIAQPLGRLCFCAYLLSTPLQFYRMSLSRTPGVLTMSESIWNIIPSLFYTYLLSFILMMVVEEPFTKLGKAMMDRLFSPVVVKKTTNIKDKKSD